MASGPGPGYGLPPADTGNFLLNGISRVLLVFIRVERRIDPFIRPAFNWFLRDWVARLVTGMKNLQRRNEERLELAEEREQPNEEKHLDDIIETFKAQMRGLWNPGHFERGGNTKTHGIVRAEFIVRDDLPEHMRHGIYAEPRTYRAWVRFSGPGPYITPDIDDVGFMSMSIKLMGVPGPKLMDDEQGTQDMIGVSTPTFVTPDTKANAHLQHWSLRNAAVFHFMNLRGPHLLDSIMQLLWTKTQTSPLESEYFSCVPYLLGEGQAMQYSFRHAAEVADARAAVAFAAAGQLSPRRDGRDAGRAGRRVRHLAPGADRPVQDADREQRGAVADPAVAARAGRRCCGSRSRRSTRRSNSRSRGCSRYNPWHSIPEHRPLGNQSRARKRMYYELSQLRQQMNNVEHYEPTGDETF